MTKSCRRKVLDDPIVAVVRKEGEELAREANHDLHALCERLREAERHHPERLITIPPHPRPRK